MSLRIAVLTVIYLLYSIKNSEAVDVDRLHKVLHSQDWHRADPGWKKDFHHYTVNHFISSEISLFRLQPMLIHPDDSDVVLPVFNADRILLLKHGDRDLTPHHAYAPSLKSHFSKLSLTSPFAKTRKDIMQAFKVPVSMEHIQPAYFYDKSFVQPYRAAYRVLNVESGPIQSHEELFVDATNGRTLFSRPLMHHATANFSSGVFAYVYPNGYRNTSAPVLMSLPNVIPDYDKTGVRGRYRTTANQCPYYVCDPNGASTQNPGGPLRQCSSRDVVCFSENNLMSVIPSHYRTLSNSLVITQNEVFTVNFTYPYLVTNFDAEIDWSQAGFVNNTLYVRYAGMPATAGRIEIGATGLFGRGLFEYPVGATPPPPINGTNATMTYAFNMSDPFDVNGEAQIYQLAESFYETMRAKMSDQFCFNSNQTALESSILQTSVLNVNASGNPAGYDGSMMLATNLRIPHPTLEFLQGEIIAGRGRTAADPLVIGKEWLGPFENAFFYNNKAGVKPSSCVDGSCLFVFSQGNSAVPYLGFGQGADVDWTFDHCLAYHEMMHSVTKELVPNIGDTVRGPWGSVADPGTINEAWSDYWAALKCNVSDLATSPFGLIKRNLVNSKTSCGTLGSNNVTHITGEIHADSVIFSGGLYQVRLQIESVNQSLTSAFDDIVLLAEAMANSDETMTRQFNTILKLLNGSSLLSNFTSFATTVFYTRDISCNGLRIYNLANATDTTGTVSSMYFAPLGRIGTSDYVAAPIQLSLSVPVWPRMTVTSFVLVEYGQIGEDNYFFNTANQGHARTPMKFVYSWNCPVWFDYSFGLTLPRESCGNNNSLTVHTAESSVTLMNDSLTSVQGWFKVPKPTDSPTDVRTVFIVILSDKPIGMTLTQITGRPTLHGTYLIVLFTFFTVLVLMMLYCCRTLKVAYAPIDALSLDNLNL